MGDAAGEGLARVFLHPHFSRKLPHPLVALGLEVGRLGAQPSLVSSPVRLRDAPGLPLPHSYPSRTWVAFG